MDLVQGIFIATQTALGKPHKKLTQFISPLPLSKFILAIPPIMHDLLMHSTCDEWFSINFFTYGPKYKKWKQIFIILWIYRCIRHQMI